MKITEEDYQKVANDLGIEVAAIKAVAKVEAPGGGFMQGGQVTILFERHQFHKYTKGKYSRDYPEISNPKPGGYTRNEHKRLVKAVSLDRTAALKSTSWGKFQIMGFNYDLCGFNSLQEFINEMYQGEVAQLMAFAQFIKRYKLVGYLKDKDWAGFARKYNGKYYYKNEYDVKLRDAYEYYSSMN